MDLDTLLRETENLRYDKIEEFIDDHDEYSRLFDEIESSKLQKKVKNKLHTELYRRYDGYLAKLAYRPNMPHQEITWDHHVCMDMTMSYYWPLRNLQTRGFIYLINPKYHGFFFGKQSAHLLNLGPSELVKRDLILGIVDRITPLHCRIIAKDTEENFDNGPHWNLIYHYLKHYDPGVAFAYSLPEGEYVNYYDEEHGYERYDITNPDADILVGYAYFDLPRVTGRLLN